MQSPTTKWIEKYSPDDLWRESLWYKNGVLVGYSLEKRAEPTGIIWTILVRLEKHPRTNYLFKVLKIHKDWKE